MSKKLKKAFWSKKEKKVLEKELKKDEEYWDNIGDKIYELYVYLPQEYGYSIDVDYNNHTFVLYKTPSNYIKELDYERNREDSIIYEGTFEDYKDFKKFVNKRMIYSPEHCFVYLMLILCIINISIITIKIFGCFKDTKWLSGVSTGIVISMVIGVIVDSIFSGKNYKNRMVCCRDKLIVDDKILTSYTRKVLKDMEKEDKEEEVVKRGRKKKAKVESDSKNN